MSAAKKEEKEEKTLKKPDKSDGGGKKGDSEGHGFSSPSSYSSSSGSGDWLDEAELELMQHMASRALLEAVDEELGAVISSYGTDLVGAFAELSSLFVSQNRGYAQKERKLNEARTRLREGLESGGVVMALVKLRTEIQTINMLYEGDVPEECVVQMVTEVLPPWGNWIKQKWLNDGMPDFNAMKAVVMETYNLHCREEMSKGAKQKVTDITMAAFPKTGLGKRGDRRCHICDKTGHSYIDCYDARRKLKGKERITLHRNASQWAKEKGIGYLLEKIQEKIRDKMKTDEKKTAGNSDTHRKRNNIQEIKDKIAALTLMVSDYEEAEGGGGEEENYMFMGIANEETMNEDIALDIALTDNDLNTAVKFLSPMLQANDGKVVALLDSGSSKNLFNKERAFEYIDTADRTSIKGIGGGIHAQGKGTARLKSNEGSVVSFSASLLVPTLPFSIVSLRALEKGGAKIFQI